MSPFAAYNRSTPQRELDANIQRYYDLSSNLYRLFLDEDMQYSYAYFVDTSMTLEEAQLAKKAHIATKMHIKA